MSSGMERKCSMLSLRMPQRKVRTSLATWCFFEKQLKQAWGQLIISRGFYIYISDRHFQKLGNDPRYPFLFVVTSHQPFLFLFLFHPCTRFELCFLLPLFANPDTRADVDAACPLLLALWISFRDDYLYTIIFTCTVFNAPSHTSFTVYITFHFFQFMSWSPNHWMGSITHAIKIHATCIQNRDNSICGTLLGILNRLGTR